MGRGHRVLPADDVEEFEAAGRSEQAGAGLAETRSSKGGGAASSSPGGGAAGGEEVDWFEAGWGGGVPDALRISREGLEDAADQAMREQLLARPGRFEWLWSRLEDAFDPVMNSVDILLDRTEQRVQELGKLVPVMLLGQSFRVLSPNNPLRLIAFYLLHLPGLRLVFMVLTLGACATIIMRPSGLSDSEQVEQYDQSAAALLTLEVLLHSVAYGVGIPRPSDSFQADLTLLWNAEDRFFNRLDVLVLAGAWSEVVMVRLGHSRFTLRPLRLFRVLYVFSRAFRWHFLRWVWDSAKRGQRLLFGVLAIGALTLLALASVFTHAYGGAYRMVCAHPNTSAPAVPEVWCVEGQDGTCPEPFACALPGAAAHGFAHFDHVGGALTVLVAVVSDEVWLHLPRALSAYPDWWPASAALFAGAAVFGSFLALSLAVAVGAALFGGALTLREGRVWRACHAPERALAMARAERAARAAIRPMDAGSRAVFATRDILRALVASRTFAALSLLCIALDAGARLAWRVGATEEEEQVLGWIEVVTTALFVCEALLKLLAAGSAAEFYREHRAWGLVELAVVFASAVALTLARTGLEDASSYFFRHALMLRLLNLAHAVPGTRAVLSMLVAAAKLNVTALLFLLWAGFAWALMGRMLFDDALEGLDERGGARHTSFRNFLWSCVSVLRIHTADAWAQVASDGMQAAYLMEGTAHAAYAAVFVYSCFFLGHYFLALLFLAANIPSVSVGGFWELVGDAHVWQSKKVASAAEDADEGKDGGDAAAQAAARKEVHASKAKVQEAPLHVQSLDSGDDDDSWRAIDAEHHRLALEGRDDDGAYVTGEEEMHSMDPPTSEAAASVKQSQPGLQHSGSMEGKAAVGAAHSGAMGAAPAGEAGGPQATTDPANRSKDPGEPEEPAKQTWFRKHLAPALGLFHQACVWISSTTAFELFYLGSTLAACAVIGRRPFLPPSAQEPHGWELYVLYATTGTLLVEVVIHLGARAGKQWYPGAHDLIDLGVLAASCADFLGAYGSVVKPLRLYKVAASPLVARHVFSQLPIVLGGLRASVFPLVCVIAVWVLVCLLFAAIAIRQFGGRFGRCVDFSAQVELDCAGFYFVDQGDESIVLPRSWVKADLTFDDVWASLLTLLVMSTLKWSDVAFSAVDFTGVDTQPRPYAHDESLAFFVIFMPLVCFIVFGAMAAMVISGVSAAGTEEDRRARAYSLLVARIEHERPWKKETHEAWGDGNVWVLGLRMRLLDSFSQFMFESCNLLACLLSLAYHQGMPEDMAIAYTALSYAFALVTFVELFLHAFTFGPSHFPNSLFGWGLAVAVAGAVAGSYLEQPKLLALGLAARMIRAVPNVTRVTFRGPLERSLHTGLSLSLPRVLAVAYVGACAVCAAACIGVQAFGTAREGRVLGDWAAFDSFGEAAATMYLVLLGAPWHILMFDCAVQPPLCVIGDDCGAGAGAYAFFILFKLAAQLLFLNMMVSATLEGFLEAYSLECGPLSSASMRELRKLWCEADPDRNMWIPFEQMMPLLSELSTPLSTEWMRALRPDEEEEGMKSGHGDLGGEGDGSEGEGGEEEEKEKEERMLPQDDPRLIEFLSEMEIVAGLRMIREEGYLMVARLPATGSGLSACQLGVINVRALSGEEMGEALARARKWGQEHEYATIRGKTFKVQRKKGWGILASLGGPAPPGERPSRQELLLQTAYPDLQGQGPCGVAAGSHVRYRDIALALVHLHAPGCEPEVVRRRREEVLRVVRMRVAARRIVAFLRRREEWRKTWGNPLRLIREEIRRQHEEEARQEREAAARRAAEEEEERRRLEEERLERLRLVPHHSMPAWAAFAAQRAPSGVPPQVVSYFSRCVYYHITVPLPAGPREDSLLQPSVSEAALERFGYAPQRSASVFRTVAVPEEPPEGEEYGDAAGYTPAGLALAINEAVRADLRAYARCVEGSSIHHERQWEDLSSTMLRFNSLGNQAGYELVLSWPGPFLGIEGLGLSGMPITADAWVSVRVFAGLHSAYAMAASQSLACSDLRRDTLPNLMALMGLNKGSSEYHCHLLAGYQGCVCVGGGADALMGNPPEDIEGQLVAVHSEESAVGREAFEQGLEGQLAELDKEVGLRVLGLRAKNRREHSGRVSRTVSTMPDSEAQRSDERRGSRVGTLHSVDWHLWGDAFGKEKGAASLFRPATSQTDQTAASVRRRQDEEFLFSYAREYRHMCLEGIALVVLQAKLRAKTVKLNSMTRKVRQQYIGDKVTQKIDLDRFMKRRARRETSMSVMVAATGEQHTGLDDTGSKKASWVMGSMSLLMTSKPWDRDKHHSQRLDQRIDDTTKLFWSQRQIQRQQKKERKATLKALRDGPTPPDVEMPSAEDYTTEW